MTTAELFGELDKTLRRTRRGVRAAGGGDRVHGDHSPSGSPS